MMMITLKEGRRWPGSEWLKDHPAFLETSYAATKRLVKALYPVMKRISPHATEQLMLWAEQTSKGYLFNCQMCGQCILHSTGMTCPMNCPKNLRNGPCGGVRANGHCEVRPEMKCVWTEAVAGSARIPGGMDALQQVQVAVDRRLQGRSSWLRVVRQRVGEI